MAEVPPHPCHVGGCPGTCRYLRDELDSLRNGGSYEMWRCDVCAEVTWIPLPD